MFDLNGQSKTQRIPLFQYLMIEFCIFLQRNVMICSSQVGFYVEIGYWCGIVYRTAGFNVTIIFLLDMQRSLKILFIFVLPCFAAESIYKIWWYSSGGTQIPFLGNVIVSDVVACLLELSSWLYRTTVFFLVCVLFRLICYLQILRLRDFAQIFHIDSDVETVLREHLRIRRHLRIISHRYRIFILLALIFVTASQFASLLMTTRSTADLHIYKSGELAVWLLISYLICQI